MKNEKLRHLLILGFAFCLLHCTAALAAVSDGYVVRVESSTAYLDWGKNSGVQTGDRFSIYREGEVLKHPVTGEILGHAEQTLGSGTLQSIEDKFSIGQLDQIQGSPKAGDRTRWQTTSLTVEPSSSSETNLAPASPALNELWRSDPLEKDPVGIAFGDIDGSGTSAIVVAYLKKIVAYRLKDKHLETIASFDNWHYRHWISLDIADLKHDGHPEIFATDFLDGLKRPRLVVLHFDNGTFKVVGEIEGFARAIQRLDGSRHLYWQNLARSRDMSFTAVSELTWDKDAYKTGSPLNLQLFDDQLFGFVWGVWDKDSAEELAILEHGERIRLRFKATKWLSGETYGGTKNEFSVNEQQGTVYPRLFYYHPGQGDRDQLLVPRNISELGVRLRYLKLYKKSELYGLVWNGLELQPAWHLSIAGYLADYGIADILGTSTSQLWVAATGPGDKTILVSYSLP